MPLNQDTEVRWRWISTTQLIESSIELSRMLPYPIRGIVGVPRSGMIAASTIASHLNLPLYAYSKDGVIPLVGTSRRGDETVKLEGPLVLVDDDSYSGVTLNKAKETMAEDTLTATPFAHTGGYYLPQYSVHKFPCGWLAEWRVFSGGWWIDPHVAYDFDGILCDDCPIDSDDDGPKYLEFLRNTKPKWLSHRATPIPLVITARTERYRAETETWMKRWGIFCNNLVMRQPGRWDLGQIVNLKALTWLKYHSLTFFFESDSVQAKMIADIVPRPVVCPTTGEIFNATLLTVSNEDRGAKMDKRPECRKFSGRLSDICRGCAGLPAYKINSYRRKWGLFPLDEADVDYILPVVMERPQATALLKGPTETLVVDRPRPKFNEPARSGGGCCGGGRQKSRQPVVHQLNGTGPGSQLLKLWADMPHCDACLALALQMDAWGKETCAQRLDLIVEDILPRAQVWMRENRPWIHRILAATATEQMTLRLAITTNVRKAIRLAET